MKWLQKWLQLPGIVLLLTGAFCSVSLYRYYDNAVIWQEKAREIERESGDGAGAAAARSLAAAAQTKNLLWGLGAAVGFIGGGVLVLLPYFVRRPTGGNGKSPPERRAERRGGKF